MRMFAIAAVAAVMATGAAAQTAQVPAEVKVVEGRFADKAGKPLYIFTMDTMREMSHCEGRCAEAWPPLIAPAGAKPMGAWYIIKREGGQMQWAYKDKPLYTYAKDKAGEAPTGENDIWKLARP